MGRSKIGILGAALVFGAACEDGGAPAGEGEASSDDGAGETDAEGSDSSGSATTGAEADVVYWRDIKPIVDARCGACHSADGVAPFTLQGYDDVAQYGELMLAAIEAGDMPPWPVAEDCNDYMFDPSLSDGEKDRFASWIGLGKPEGDPADEGEPLALASQKLPRVDFEIAMAEPHMPAPPSGEVDEHRCFLLDWPEAADAYVTGYEVVPGNRKVVHHLVARVIGPDDVAAYEDEDDADEGDGWECGAGTGMSGGSGPLLGVWVPGGGATVLPEGTGMRVETGSRVLLNMHYNTLMGDVAPDQTSVRFMVEDSVEIEGESQFVSDPTWPIGDNMLIPAGDPDSLHIFDVRIPVAGKLYAGGLHMHKLGSYASLVVEHGDGSMSCAFDIPQWDFDWQLGYRLATPIEGAAGDRIVLQCGFDNSAEHQEIIDGERREPQDVTWGEDTYDEMCLGFIYVTRD